MEENMNVEQLADAIGCDRSTMYRKLDNPEKITIGEANKMVAALSMNATEATEIFLM